ncbi:MAG: aldo/keto reductase, partial [Candidatus Sumerlaeota bacterium]
MHVCEDIPQLPKIELGRTGYKLSRLAIGGFHQVEITCDIVNEVVDAFLELGGNYIETARGYGAGASEEKLGRVLKGRRDQVVLTSKSGNPTADGIRKDLEATLENLQTDYLDFYFYHGVGSEEQIGKIAGPGGAAEGLAKAKDEGLLRGGAGLSSHRPWIYKKAIDRLDLSLILIWSNYLEDMYLPEISSDIIPYALEKGVGVTAMKPLGDGFLYRSVEDAFRWTLGGGAEILVSGMNSPDHVRQAAAAIAKGPINDDERQRILREAPELGR